MARLPASSRRSPLAATLPSWPLTRKLRAPPGTSRPRQHRGRPDLLEDRAAAAVGRRAPPGGWHLNRRRVPVPPVPRSGRERTEEILRRRALLPPDLVHDPAYAVNSHMWDRWLEMEHDHRRRLAFAA